MTSQTTNDLPLLGYRDSELQLHTEGNAADAVCLISDANSVINNLQTRLDIATTYKTELETALATASKQEDHFRKLTDSKQAVIDRLMLEYCPSEMTEEQLENWAKHQRRSTLKHQDIELALTS